MLGFSYITDYKTTGNFSAEVFVEGVSTLFSFTLYSARRPLIDIVEFVVNDRSIDFIRFYNHTCYSKKGECTVTECSCFFKDKYFLLIYKYRASLSCKSYIFGFTFIDEDTPEHKITLSRTYNGKGKSITTNAVLIVSISLKYTV